MITAAVIAVVAPNCNDPDLHAPGLAAAAADYEIDSPARQAMWLAQLACESAEFNRLEEDLRYSAERIVQVWPGRFKTIEQARPFERQPERLANFVYDDANRAPGRKLGNDAPGDGWKYRGRGYIQITGKANYVRSDQAIGVDLLNFPQRASEPEIAARIAAEYWRGHGCNALADADDFEAITRAIAGSLQGWALRRTYLRRAKEGEGI